MSPDEQRKIIRSRMKNRLAGLPEADRYAAAVRCCSRLKAAIPWREARAVLAYLAFGAELNADPVIEAALAEGKTVFTPVVLDAEMDFRSVESLTDPFSTGPFGIREPRDGRRWSPLATPGPALVIVPGVAFTTDGGRLGRGGGYYDRFIAKVRLEATAAGEQPPVFIGYAYDEQLQDRLPLEPHDEVLDGIITESRTILL